MAAPLRHLLLGWRTLFSIALRNVLRARRRSSFGIAAVGFGVVALLLAGGFIDWAVWSMRENLISTRLGHLQIAKPDYFDIGFSDPYRFVIPENAAERAAIQAIPHVKSVTPRFQFTGLLSKGEATVSFLGEGLEASDPSVRGIGAMLMQGRVFREGEENAILLGKGLAKNIGARIGDRVTLLATTRSGGLNAVEAEVIGTFASSAKAFEDAAVQMPRALALKLVRAKGAHVWVVSLSDTAYTEQVARTLAPQVKAAGLELTPWYRLADFYNKTVDLFQRQTLVMKGIIAFIIILCISNTLLMTVAERTGEIGTSLALGLKRRTVFAQFMAEGILLGCVGAALGLGLGYGLAQLISSIGIPLPPPPNMSIPLRGEIRLSSGLTMEALCIVLSTTALASAYPAWRACRMEIVNALRFNR